MRESQPIAFRASWKLTAKYESYAEEDGEDAWAAAPKGPTDALLYEEVYVQRKLLAPSDPESVIIKRPHCFSEAVPSQLMPPHPLDNGGPPEVQLLQTRKHSHFIGMHLYAPITCGEASHEPLPTNSFGPCIASQAALLATVMKSKKIPGVFEFETHIEVGQLKENIEEFSSTSPASDYQ